MQFRRLYPAFLAGVVVLSACGESAPATTQSTTVVTPTAEDSGQVSHPGAQVTRLWIRPDLVDCQGEAPQKCMQVAESDNGAYEFFYDTIEGFTFDEGTSYVIDVTIDQVPEPSADGSSLRYTLVQIVEATESTN